jgi:hypothetical protein
MAASTHLSAPPPRGALAGRSREELAELLEKASLRVRGALRAAAPPSAAGGLIARERAALKKENDELRATASTKRDGDGDGGAEMRVRALQTRVARLEAELAASEAVRRRRTDARPRRESR